MFSNETAENIYDRLIEIGLAMDSKTCVLLTQRYLKLEKYKNNVIAERERERERGDTTLSFPPLPSNGTRPC